jgi:hypothetical protein
MDTSSSKCVTPNTTSFDNHHNHKDSPNSAEDTFCWNQEDHIQEGIQNFQKRFIGKLLSEKIVTKKIIQNTLLGIWGDP